jgi:hypothetical protein
MRRSRMESEKWHTLLILPKKSGYYKVKYFNKKASGTFIETVYYDVKTGWDLSLKYTISLWKEIEEE